MSSPLRHAVRVSAAIVLGLGLSVLPVQAQEMGRISGIVVDPSGAALPGATVTVTHDDTRFGKTAVTDGNGAYLATHLPVGRYTVIAELQGFKKVVKSGHDLVTDGRVTVNFTLELGAVTETIEVVAQVGETVNNVSGEIARVVDGEQVQDMALNGRNYMELATLVPGVPVLNDDAIEQMTSLGGNTSVNGQRVQANNVTLDGVYNLDSGSNGTLIANVGVDFIEQVNIKTSNFSAEYGRQSGANINVTTRSGTNRFAGGARWFMRDEKFDATNPALKRVGLEKRSLDFDTFGWNFGGPLKHDRLFFFVGQEWKQVRRFTDATRRTLPTTAELRGDFSARSSVFLRDPRKTGTCSATDQTACFSDPKRIPADRITADGRAIASLFERMQQEAAAFDDTPTSNNATYTKPNPYDQRQNIVRLDYHANQKHRLNGRLVLDDYKIEAPFGTFIDSQLPTTPTLRDRPARNFQIGHIWTFSQHVTNDFKIGSSWNGQRMQPVGDVWRRDTYGFQFPQVYEGGGRLAEAAPRVAVNGFGTAESLTRALISPTTDIGISDRIAVVHGRHSIVGGVSYTRNRKDQNTRTNYAGNITFNASGNPNSTGNAFADALLGNFRTYTEAETDNVGFFRFSQIEGFVSDTWRVSRQLSIEAGLRYQWHLPIYTQANNVSNFDPARYDPSQAVRINPTNGNVIAGSGNRYNGLVRAGDGVPSEELSRVTFGSDPRVQLVPTGAPRGLYGARHNLMPRLSFAWSPGGRENFAVRGGAGIFYDRTEGNMIFTTAASPPWNESGTFDNGNLANPTGGAQVFSTGALGTIEAIDPNLKVPQVTQWSLSVQRELFKKFFAEVAYVGSVGRNLIRRPNINALSPEALRSSRAIPSAQRPNDNALRPYLGYTTINMYLSDASSDYRAIQTYIAKRRGDLTFTIAHTWGRARSDATSRTDGGTEAGEDVFGDLKENFGVAGNHRAHILAITYGYRVPFFRKSHGPVKALLHGWELTGITRLQSGSPLTPTANTAIGERRADYVGGPVALPRSERNEGHMFNTAAFAVPPEDRKGNAPRGIITGPGLQTWTMKLRKRTELTRRARLTFELDAFNVFNSSRRGNPNVTVTDSDYGVATIGGTARTLQFGTRLDF